MKLSATIQNKSRYDFDEKSAKFRESYENRQRESQESAKGFNYEEKQNKYSKGYENFDEFFSEFDDFLNFKESKKSKQKENDKVSKGKNIVLNIDISFLEAIHGAKKMVEYHRNISCKNCQGSGRESKNEDWPDWEGTGYINIRHSKGYSQQPCKKWSKKSSWR